MKKKLILGLCAAFLCVCLAGCGSGKDNESISENVGVDMENEVGVTVNFTDKVTDEVVQTLRENGITYVRIPFMWPFGPFGPDGKTLSLSYLTAKKAAQKFHEAGIGVMAQSFWPGGRGYDSSTGTITWFSNLPNLYSGFDDPDFYEDTENAVKFMAEDLKDICSTWLISNEIDISTYTGDMTFNQIVNYVKAAANGVRAGNPNASCGINMLVAEWEAYSLKFVNALYCQEDFKLDWIGLDGYYGTLQEGEPETWEEYINKFYEKAQVPIVITEWSYSSADRDPSNSLRFQWENHGPRGRELQAEYVSACMDVFTRHPEVVGTFWYALHDQDIVCWECGNPECRLYSSWGLLDVDGSPKPSLAAMRKAAAVFAGR